jgi:hypothetical protein
MHIGPTLIVYYVFAGASILCSGFVVLTLWFHGSLRTSATRLLLALHITLVCEELTSLPYVYNGNPDICTGTAFLHYYFGLASIVAVGFLVVSYRYHFFPDLSGVNKFIQSWALPLVALFHLITFLPFITATYQEHQGPWCSIGGHRNDHTWTFAVFYVWVWLILFFSAVWLVITMVQIYKIDRLSGHRLFSTVGMYSIVSIITWIPRTVEQVTNFTSGKLNAAEWIISYLPLYVAGILYTLVFLTEKKALILFDSAFRMDQRDFDERTHSSFSWEGSSFRFTNSSHAEGSQYSANSVHSGRISMTDRAATKSLTISPMAQLALSVDSAALGSGQSSPTARAGASYNSERSEP